MKTEVFSSGQWKLMREYINEEDSNSDSWDWSRSLEPLYSLGISQSSSNWRFYHLLMGRGFSTAVDRMPWEQKLESSWV